MKTQQKWLVVAAAALTFVLTACGTQSSKDSSSSSKQQVWHRMEADVLQTLDPSKASEGVSGQAIIDTMNGLYKYYGHDLQPAMATKIVKPTNNGLTYTFTLRNAKWSDGTPVTAQDFVFAWQRTVDPATKSTQANMYSGIKNADDIRAGKKPATDLGIKAINDKTLEVTLEHPIPYFNSLLNNVAFFPQPAKKVKAWGAKYGTKSQYTLSNGAFKSKGWTGTGDKWTEVKNTNYWNKKNVHLTQIDVQVVKDTNTALDLYRTGKLDDANLTGQLAAQQKGKNGYVATKRARTYFLELNENKVPAFKNTKIRQAISMAINRDSFVKNVLADGSIVARGITPADLSQLPDSSTDYATAVAKNTKAITTYNKKKAQTLWAEGLKEVGTKTVDVELLGDDVDAVKATQEYLQGALQENLPGLKISIASVPAKNRQQRAATHDFDIVLSTWGADYPDPNTYLDLFTSSSEYNHGQWQNADYDKLMAKSNGADANNPTARFKDMTEAEQLLVNQAGAIPLYQLVAARMVNPKIHDLKTSPGNSFNFVYAYLK